MKYFKIPNNKHQIIAEMPMTEIQKKGMEEVLVDLKIGNWNLFVI